jgi:N-acetylglucosamine-6-sulfatase
MRRLALAIALAAAVTVAGISSGEAGSPPAATAKARPNVVFILTDDLAWNLVKYMPQVRDLRRRGTTFTRYFVTDSLCCPSRSSIFSGRFPHNTRVFTNLPPDGGFQLFHNRHEERSTFATALRSAGYQTGFMGKYLNGYKPSSLFVPSGWGDWHGAGNAYREFNYDLNENGRLVHYGNQASDYLTDVDARKGSDFIDRAAAAHKPFALEIATFAPHKPATPAPRDQNDFPGLKAPRGPAFNRATKNAPSWLAGRGRLGPAAIRQIDALFRKRAQSIQAVDDLIAGIESTLAARGLLDNTYIVFSSDNGFHLGEHRLRQGKQTAFETDIRVPLIVVGPGIPKGRTVRALAENVDLRPTFSRLAGAKVPNWIDGRSLVPWLHGHSVKGWRRAVPIEHHGQAKNGNDPDLEPGGRPPTYEAIRLASSIYVEYKNGDREYYNLARDPNELSNTYRRLSRSKRGKLHRMLRALERCRGVTRCAKAAR